MQLLIQEIENVICNKQKELSNLHAEKKHIENVLHKKIKDIEGLKDELQRLKSFIGVPAAVSCCNEMADNCNLTEFAVMGLK